MKYKNQQEENKSRLYERRVVRKFLFIPRNFPNSKKTRWLEFANIVEEMAKEPYLNTFGSGYTFKYHWKEIGFADMEENDGII